MLGKRLRELLGSELPLIQAPMAGAQDSRLAVAVCSAGGVGSLPCAMLTVDEARTEIARLHELAAGPFNVNFFCHEVPVADAAREARWMERLAPYYREFELEQVASPGAVRGNFDAAMCEVIEETLPPIVSFHFGLPEQRLLDRVRQTGARVLASATSPAEARWLEERGVDAVIAQGFEAGGHQGIFLREDAFSQVGTFALVPLIVDAVRVPVIAAGGVANGGSIAAALALGASGVQIGTAYLATPEATISARHRDAVRASAERGTALTNVFTGRVARGVRNRLIDEVGPITPDAPSFPLAGAALAPLRESAERAGSSDFTPMWSGQAGSLARDLPAAELTRLLWSEAIEAASALGAS